MKLHPSFITKVPASFRSKNQTRSPGALYERDEHVRGGLLKVCGSVVIYSRLVRVSIRETCHFGAKKQSHYFRRANSSGTIRNPVMTSRRRAFQLLNEACHQLKLEVQAFRKSLRLRNTHLTSTSYCFHISFNENFHQRESYSHTHTHTQDCPPGTKRSAFCVKSLSISNFVKARVYTQSSRRVHRSKA